jgi:glutathione reductase (NADPH)
MKTFDVIVVGTGTAGYTVVQKCREAGLTVAVVEADEPGGVCARFGCQPKKFFVVQAELSRLAQHLAGKGFARQPELDWGQTEAFKREFTSAVPGNSEAFFAKVGATLIRGRARFLSSGVLQVGQQEYQAANIVLATGAHPRVLEIPGAELTLNSNDFLAQEELPRSIVFIGGGYISFEFAHVAAAYGAQVTIIEQGDQVLRPFEAELVEAAVTATRAAGIDVHVGQEPVAVERTEAGLVVRCRNGASCDAAAVFAAAGRVANVGELNLASLGVESDPRGLAVDEKMQVAGQPGLYAVGDCARTISLAPVADREALVAAANITGESLVMDYGIVPSVCFTQPPLASVGLTEAAAVARGLAFTVRRGEMKGWPNQRRLGAQHGRFKLLVSEKGTLLGAHVLGHEAGDLINLFALAMKGGMQSDVFKEMMWAYPTLSSDTKYMV